MGANSVLVADDVSARHKSHNVLHNCSLVLDRGAICTVFGHNGAGKTTLLRTIVGLTTQTTGTITYNGQYIHKLTTNQRTQHRIRLVPQGGGSFPNLTVDDNFRMVLGSSADEKAFFEFFPELAIKQFEYAGNLSGGQRQMLALSLAMLSSPSLLLLDEPSVGLQPNLVQKVLNVVQEFKRTTNCSVIMVEQNIETSLSLADQVVVMNQGSIIYDEFIDLVSLDDIWKRL